MKRIAVLGSGAGTNFQALVDFPDLDAEISLVISDCPDSGILEKAKAAGIPTIVEKGGSNLCARLLSRLEEVDLICLAGFMRLIKEPLLSAFPKKILNIHPSLLPKYPGMGAWVQALEDGAAETGCTVHYVDAGMDTGEIIMQARVPVLPSDTPDSLHARIQKEEHQLYPRALNQVLARIE